MTNEELHAYYEKIKEVNNVFEDKHNHLYRMFGGEGKEGVDIDLDKVTPEQREELHDVMRPLMMWYQGVYQHVKMIESVTPGSLECIGNYIKAIEDYLKKEKSESI